MNPYPHMITIKKDNESHTLIFNKSTFSEFAEKKTIEEAVKLLWEVASPQMVSIHELFYSVTGLKQAFLDYTWSLQGKETVGSSPSHRYSGNMVDLIMSSFIKSIWERVTFQPVSGKEVSDIYRDAFAEVKVCEEDRVELAPIPFELKLRPTFASSWSRIEQEFPDLHAILVQHGFVSSIDSLALEGKFDASFDVEFSSNTRIVVL